MQDLGLGGVGFGEFKFKSVKALRGLGVRVEYL